jgi:hypothetical protein
MFFKKANEHFPRTESKRTNNFISKRISKLWLFSFCGSLDKIWLCLRSSHNSRIKDWRASQQTNKQKKLSEIKILFSFFFIMPFRGKIQKNSEK